jgi:hypothetical protein
VTEYTYNAAHRMLTIKDPRSIVYLTNEYDTSGRVIGHGRAVDGGSLLMNSDLEATELRVVKGLIERGRFDEAFSRCVRLSEGGSSAAQLQLGWMYQAGKGVQKDSEKAESWYSRAIRPESGVAEFARITQAEDNMAPGLEPVRSLEGSKDLLNGAAKGGPVDCGIAVEHRLDRVEVGQRLAPLDQGARQHLLHVGEILTMAPFDFGERLSVEIEMVKRDASRPADERAAILPARAHGNEVVWRGELQIELQTLLERRQRPEEPVAIGHDLQVDVDSAGPPAEEHSGRAAREVDARIGVRLVAKRLHQPPDPSRIR